MALKGTLGDFSLADILQLIGLQRKTGLLVLRGPGGEEVRLGFETGRVVSAESSARPVEQRIGRFLVRAGKLTEERLEEALRLQRETLQRFGVLLVERGWVDAPSMRRQLRLQVTETVFALFRWRDGEYDFEPREAVAWDREFVEPIACETLLMEGAQIIDEWPLLVRVIPTPEVVLRPTPALARLLATADSLEAQGSVYEQDIDFGFIPADPLQETGAASRLTDREVAVLRWVDGKRTAMEVAELSEHGSFEALKTLARMVEAKLVEPVPGAPTEPEEPRGPALLRSARPARVAAALLALAASFGALVALEQTLTAAIPSLAALQLPAPLAGAQWIERSFGLTRIRRAASVARMERIERALEVHYLATSAWPRSLEDLVARGLLPAHLLRDPWGHAYRYELSEDGYRLAEPPDGAGRAAARERIFTPLERSAAGALGAAPAR